MCFGHLSSLKKYLLIFHLIFETYFYCFWVLWVFYSSETIRIFHIDCMNIFPRLCIFIMISFIMQIYFSIFVVSFFPTLLYLLIKSNYQNHYHKFLEHILVFIDKLNTWLGFFCWLIFNILRIEVESVKTSMLSYFFDYSHKISKKLYSKS